MKQTNLKKYGSSCSLNNKSVKEKATKTMQERYGVTSPAQLEEVRQKMRATSMAKYGTDNPMKSASVKEKVASTNIERYGSKCSLVSKEVLERKSKTMLERYGSETYNNIEKYRATCLERYGVTSPRKLESCEQKRKQTVDNDINDFVSKNNVIEYSSIADEYKVNDIHSILDVVEYKNRIFIRQKDLFKLEDYKRSKSAGRSCQETELLNYVRSICDDVISNTRSVIAPKELDIYVPSKNVAIEYDGLFWHSDFTTSEKEAEKRHLEKTKRCNELGIRLIHIYEDEWLNKKSIVKSLIASSLGVYEKTYFARKLDVVELQPKEAKQFFEDNHIQGHVNAQFYLGLMDGENIVEAVSIGKNRFKKNSIELIRMATRLNCQVVGGFSKLIKHSMEMMSITTLDSYVDRRLFNGKGYEAAGWTLQRETKPRYFYTDFHSRLNRLMFTKRHCLEMWADADKELTEQELCLQHNLYRIYDCGTLVYRYE